MTDEELVNMDDDELMTHLSVALTTTEDPPADLVQRGRDAFLFRDLNEELASLVADSLTSSVSVRSDPGPRSLSFETSTVTVELDATAEGTVRHLLGTVTPPQAIAVETPEQRTVVPVDTDGRFSATVTAGPVRLHLTSPGRADQVTAWVVL